MSGRFNNTKNKKLLALCGEAQEKFKVLKADEIYRLVQSIRNEATSHTTMSAARKNLKFMSDDADCSLYMHDLNGNSFFPMGEELMFAARLDRHAGFGASPEEKITLLEKWKDWNLAANSWLGEVHVNFTLKTTFEDKNKIPAYRHPYWIPPAMVGQSDDRKTPLFIRKAESS